MEQQANKNYYQLNGGIITETNEITFPDGFTTDEANYELLVDGSRRRRKGLNTESGAGAAKAVTAFTGTECCQTYVWRNVAGDPNLDILVFRKGARLYFATADETISDGWSSNVVALDSYESSGATTANTDNLPLSFSQGRGYLLGTGPYIKPFYVDYNGGAFRTYLVPLAVRDFTTVEDGIPIDQEPVGPITDAHKYNVRNRGWREDDLNQYWSDKAKWPSRNALWWKGYKRTYGANVYEADGDAAFNSDKLEAEFFGNSSAPLGATFLNPFDTTYGAGIAGSASAGVSSLSTWTYVDNATFWEVRLQTTTDHGLTSGDDFTLDGNHFIYTGTDGVLNYLTDGSLDGTHTASAATAASRSITAVTKGATTTITTSAAHGFVTGDTVYIVGIVDDGPGGDLDAALNTNYYTITVTSTTQFTIPENTSGLTNVYASGGTVSQPRTLVFDWFGFPSDFDSWSSQYDTLGTISGDALVRPTGTAHTDSLKAVEWYAGRAFWAGFSNSEWSDTVFYSQIVDASDKFGDCYQLADPTDPNMNSLVSTDGGTLVIPGMGGVVDMVALRNSLIILSVDGVWEVSGGQRGGIFTADQFLVRKLSDDGCSSPRGWVRLEGSLLYTGPGGIYAVAPNQYTGLLEVTNIIETTIQTLWNQVTTSKQQHVQALYDDAQKRVYFMLGPDSTNNYIDTMLVLDSRTGSWSKYTFDDTQTNVGLLTGAMIPTADDPTTNKKAKFICQASASTVQVTDFDQTSFDDFSTMAQQLPYMYTGWDNVGDFQRRRQAPIVVVYSKATETGYTDNGTGWDPTNASSTLMSAFWDWTNDAVTNKIQPYPSESSGWEIYRKTRDFAPASATDVDGYPVVVTRNKVRGRGRVLQLKFLGATDKDSHILGFSLNYRISRKK